MIPLIQSEEVNNIGDPARPPTSGKYRFKGGYGRGESSGSTSFHSRAVEKPKGAQQDIRTPGSGSGYNYNHNRIRSEFSGPTKFVGNLNSTGRRSSTYSNQGGTGGTDSSEVPIRRGKGASHSGAVPLPSTHKVYRPGVGLVPVNKAGTSPLRYAVSNPGTGIGSGQGSSLGRSMV